MELHELYCFVRVIEEGGFKRATARLHISQPAMSYLIKQLEDELGVPLFHRRPRGVVPTEAGRVFLQHAHEIIGSVHGAFQAVRELSEGVGGEVRIGTVNSIGNYFLPEVLLDLCTSFGMVRPRLVCRNSDELIDALLNNKIDVAFMAEPREDLRLSYRTLAEDPICVASSPTSSLFGRASVAPAELADVPVLALSAQTPTGALIRGYLDRLHVTLQPVMTADHVETIKRAVEAGMGVALLPEMVIRDVAADGPHLGCSPLDPPLARKIVEVTGRDALFARAVDLFLDQVRRAAKAGRGVRGTRGRGHGGRRSEGAHREAGRVPAQRARATPAKGQGGPGDPHGEETRRA